MLNKPAPISQKIWDKLETQKSNIQMEALGTVLKVGDMTIDLSRHLITKDIQDTLLNLAKEADLENWREKLFDADADFNNTENRPVLHTKLRDFNNQNTAESLQKIEKLVDKIHKSGKYTDIVNLGIGGSYEGPKFVCHALKAYATHGLKAHFVANIDAHHIESVLQGLNPETTLFLIASKSFSTLETFSNVEITKQWLGDLPHKDHFVALTAAPQKAKDFGLDDDHILLMEEGVGGRYSLWSCIGFSIALSLGYESFEELLRGAREIDKHFKETPLSENAPVLMALYGLFYRNFMSMPAQAIIPYDQRMDGFVNYIQQLDMESNGKSVDRDGNQLGYKTAPVVFGGIGSNSQHSFFQLLHQGSDIISTDFIACKTPEHAHKTHNDLLANMTAQAVALSNGKPADDGKPHTFFAGNRPSTTIILPELTPFTLGMLLALYEHKVFCQGIFWHINSFDQFGVELGKKLAGDIIKGDLSLPDYLE